MDRNTGHYAFAAAIILAVIAGIIPSLRTNNAVWALIILGAVVGLLNITTRETTEFLLAVIALMLAGSAGFGDMIAVGPTIKAVLMNITAIAVPAALIVSLRVIFTLAKR